MPEPAPTTRRHIIPPSYQKLSLLLIGLVMLFYALGQARAILVPLLFSMLLAMLLDPLVVGMSKFRVPRVLGIMLAVLLAMLCLAGLGYFIATQAAHFSEALPELKTKLAALQESAERWARVEMNVPRKEVDQAVEKVKDESRETGGMIVGRTISTAGVLFAFFFLLPVFTFLLLLYKQLLLTFITKLFPSKDAPVLQDVLRGTKGVVQSYMVGLIMEAGIVTVLNWVGLMVIGVPYALLLAVLAAVLNLIPYIGMIIATILPMTIAFAMVSPTAALWVLGLYAAVQFLDNNIIVPRVVGARVELNALASIVGVMVGGALWGIPGMFLSIPLMAMLKVIFDRVPALEPFGFVLGDEVPRAERAILRKARKKPV